MESTPKLHKSFGFWSLIVTLISALSATDFFFIDRQPSDWAVAINLAVFGLILATVGLTKLDARVKLTRTAMVINFLVLIAIIWLSYFFLFG